MSEIAVISGNGKSAALFSRMITLELQSRGHTIITAEKSASVILFVFDTVDGYTLERLQKSGETVPSVLCYCETDVDIPDDIISVRRPTGVVRFCEFIESLTDRTRKSPPALHEGRELKNDGQGFVFEGRRLSLSAKESALLGCLMRHCGSPVSREELSAEAWGQESGGNDVDVYIRFLRKKIDERFEKKIVFTVRGKGYMIKK